jgi:hypothetical protein
LIAATPALAPPAAATPVAAMSKPPVVAPATAVAVPAIAPPIAPNIPLATLSIPEEGLMHFTLVIVKVFEILIDLLILGQNIPQFTFWRSVVMGMAF